MKSKRTNRPGFFLCFIVFFTVGLFFLYYMPHSLQNEIEEILGHRVVPYWKAYLLGIPTLFVYPMKSSACENISSEKSFSHAELYSKPKYKLSFPQIDRNRGVQIMANDLEFVFPLRLQHCHSAFHAIITGFQGNRFLIAEGPLNRII